MRWKDDKKGNMSFDPADSTGRIMKRVKAGEGRYLTSTEGLTMTATVRLTKMA